MNTSGAQKIIDVDKVYLVKSKAGIKIVSTAYLLADYMKVWIYIHEGQP
jgi:hypothetical protein